MKLLAPIIAALALASPALAEPLSEPQPYQIDLTVERSGEEVVRIRTQIAEGTTAEASASAAGVTYHFEASLWSVQGDGSSEQMALEANLSRGEDQLAAPRLTFLRGKDAVIEVGRPDGEILRMTVAPAQ